jgi:hypothetical protein
MFITTFKDKVGHTGRRGSNVELISRFASAILQVLAVSETSPAWLLIEIDSNRSAVLSS